MIPSITVCLFFLFLIPCASAQDVPLIQGELEIHVLPSGTNRTITVEAAGTVYDTRCNWYEANSQLSFWRKGNIDGYRLAFVDREMTCPHSSPPDTPRIGYGLYRVSVGSDYIYVDFRDADYGTLTGYTGYQDMYLNYRPNDDYFTDDNGRQIELGHTYHVWDMEPKDQSTYPVKIPATAKNAFTGGSVKINDETVSSPAEQTWIVGSTQVKVEAISPQELDGWTYTFSSWSDGGARVHYITPSLDKFATVLTANYVGYYNGRRFSSESYPNPFNPIATIKYSLPKTTFTTLEVFTATGEKLVTLVNKEMEAGSHEAQFDGTKLSSGVYSYRLSAAGDVQTKKLILNK